jgi:hypothetical protein
MKKLLTIALLLPLFAMTALAYGSAAPPTKPPTIATFAGAVLIADGPGGPPVKLPTGKPGKPPTSDAILEAEGGGPPPIKLPGPIGKPPTSGVVL